MLFRPKQPCIYVSAKVNKLGYSQRLLNMEKLQMILAGFLFLTLSMPDTAAAANYVVEAKENSPPPKIDGALDDPFWNEAAVLNQFTQYEPVEGGPPSEKTIAYIGYDSENLYIGVQAFDSNPGAIRACLTKRDEVIGDDEISVYLDTFNDKKRAFVFQVNPCGVQSDGVYTETRRRRGEGFDRIDTSWDTFFLTDAKIDAQGYSVEIQIPFKSLRFPNARQQTWGLQLRRSIRRKNEDIYWAPRSRDINGLLIQAGTLKIEGPLDKGRNFEVMPVLTGIQSAGEKFNPQPSLNLKYGITSDLTADLTVNPDFSQIEADMPKVDVNQRYPLYFPEKRPFFLEGRDIFDTPIELIYTRSIVNPAFGTKLTGKTGKTSLGFMSAYDETPTYINIPADGDIESPQENNRGLINIFRVKQDLYSESYLGFVLTDKETGNGWNNITKNHNRVGGVDGHFKFGDNTRFSFQVAGSESRVAGKNTGWVPAMNFNLSRQSRHWNISADYTHLPEDFEASLGFLRRKDMKSFRTRFGYNFLPQNDIIVDIRPSIEYRRAYDFNNTLTDEELQIGGFISGWRGSFLFGQFTSELERYEGIDFNKQNLRVHLNSDPLAWFSGNLSFSMGDGIYYDENPYLGYLVSYGFRATFKPLTNLRIFYNFNNNTFYDEKGGAQIYRINILSQRINYQLSRSLSLRLITDYNDYYSDFYGSILLSYEYRPGTVFYVGMDTSQIQDDLGIFREESQYYFVKFSYWWRI